MAESVDFSRFRFPDPIPATKGPIVEPPKSRAGSRQQSTAKSYGKLRQDGALVSKVDAYLTAYETNHYRKSMLLHQELEEHYLSPIARKLVRKTSGLAYAKYVEAKSRAVSAFDQQRIERRIEKVFPSLFRAAL
jgi:hypothetical protein